MDLNPYESPQVPVEPAQLPDRSSRPFWLDTLYLVVLGVVLYVPAALLVVLIGGSYRRVHQLSPGVLLLLLLSTGLICKIAWRRWNAHLEKTNMRVQRPLKSNGK